MRSSHSPRTCLTHPHSLLLHLWLTLSWGRWSDMNFTSWFAQNILSPSLILVLLSSWCCNHKDFAHPSLFLYFRTVCLYTSTPNQKRKTAGPNRCEVQEIIELVNRMPATCLNTMLSTNKETGFALESSVSQGFFLVSSEGVFYWPLPPLVNLSGD